MRRWRWCGAWTPFWTSTFASTRQRARGPINEYDDHGRRHGVPQRIVRLSSSCGSPIPFSVCMTNGQQVQASPHCPVFRAGSERRSLIGRNCSHSERCARRCPPTAWRGKLAGGLRRASAVSHSPPGFLVTQPMWREEEDQDEVMRLVHEMQLTRYPFYDEMKLRNTARGLGADCNRRNL